jgi:hypothetical protein
VSQKCPLLILEFLSTLLVTRDTSAAVELPEVAGSSTP